MALGKKARAGIVITAIYIIGMGLYRGALIVNRYATMATPNRDVMTDAYTTGFLASATDALIIWIVGLILYAAFRWVMKAR